MRAESTPLSGLSCVRSQNWDKVRSISPWHFRLFKNLPAMQKTLVLSLGQEDPLKREIVTLSSILTWKIPWTDEPSWPQSMGSPKRHS